MKSPALKPSGVCLLLLMSLSAHGEYSGHSDYRLLFQNHAGVNFDPNEDLLRPSPLQLKQQELREAVMGATLKSLVPLMGPLTGNFTDIEGDLLQTLLTACSTLGTELRKGLTGVVPIREKQYPIVHDTYLLISS